MYSIDPIKDDFFFLQYDGRRWPTAANAWLIKDPDGLILIDTGLNSEACFGGLTARIEEIGHRISDIHTVLLTHGHSDHIAGINAILGYTRPRIYLPRSCIAEATDPATQERNILPPEVRAIVPALRSYDILDNFKQTCGEWQLDAGDLSPIEDGEVLQFGRYRLEAIETPGHDVGLMVFREPSLRLILTTDLFRASGPGSSLPWYSTNSGGVSSYLESLDRIKEIDIIIAYPSHGAPIEDYDAAREATRAVILERDRSILHRLKSGAKRCAELDAVLFSDRLMEYCPWYSSVTHAHLSWLETKGTVRQTGDLFVLS